MQMVKGGLECGTAGGPGIKERSWLMGSGGEQSQALFESLFYTGNNLPDSPSVNERPSAARPREATHLNDNGCEGLPLLYYCRFIAAFCVRLPLQADSVSVPLIERPAS